MCSKKSALVRCEILGHFVNTFTTHENYSRCSMKNFGQQLQMPLAKNQKTFYETLIAFLKSSLNLQNFKRKDKSSSLSIFDIIDFERGGI